MPSAWAAARARPRASWVDDRPDRRGHQRRVEDVPLVAVEADRVANRLAIAAAGHDDRNLRGEIDPALGDTRRPAQAGPRDGGARRPVDQDLSLAVIARGGRFEDQGQPEAVERRRRARSRVRTGRQGAWGMSWRARKRFSRSRFWLIQSGPPAGTHPPPAGQPPQRGGRDVLELDGHRLGPIGEGPQGR